jgi:hypothetical protein
MNFVACLGIQKNPAKFNDFSRIFGYKYPMFVARRSNMDHYIAIETRLLSLIVCHSPQLQATGKMPAKATS